MPWDYSETILNLKLWRSGVYNRQSLRRFFADCANLGIRINMGCQWADHSMVTLEDLAYQIQSLSYSREGQCKSASILDS